MNQGIKGESSGGGSGRGVVDSFSRTQERPTGGSPWVQHTANGIYEERCQKNQHGQIQPLIRQKPLDL